MNYYDVLEVSPNASKEVIRAAYKSLIQRYHPDRNPDDSAIAERASLVVQAYEVLSDADKRSAYDRTLQEATAGAPGPAANRNRPAPRASTGRGSDRGNRHFWPLVLLILAIGASGWLATSLLKKKLAPEKAAADGNGTSAAARAKALAAREIPRFVTGFSVILNDREGLAENAERTLAIAVIGVRVGTPDTENAIRHLHNTKEPIQAKLQEKLANARYGELIKVDADQYLARLILDTIGEVAGTGPSIPPLPPASESPDRYGVVEVLLPQSFSVR